MRSGEYSQIAEQNMQLFKKQICVGQLYEL